MVNIIPSSEPLRSDYIISDLPPTAAEYIALRGKIGWDSVKHKVAQNSLNHSLFNTTVRLDGKLIGMARVVGDGIFMFRMSLLPLTIRALVSAIC